jgi:hypothetical protein
MASKKDKKRRSHHVTKERIPLKDAVDAFALAAYATAWAAWGMAKLLQKHKEV